MWFRNLLVYRLAAPWTLDADTFEASLGAQALQPCASFAMESRGWVPPRDDGRFLYTLNRHWLFALGFDQKLLPSTVIRQVADERAVELGKRQGYPVGRKQMRDLRIQVSDELMPRALTRRRMTRAWLDTVNGTLALDLSADAKADDLMQALVRSNDRLPTFVRLDTERTPGGMMTQWVGHGDAPEHFSIDRDLELMAADGSKAIVRYANHPLDGRDIPAHIKAGKTATRLGMTWRDRIAFVLTDQMQVKRLDFLDVLRSEGGEESQDADEKFDIDFALMTGELAGLIADLTAALGGVKK